MQALLPTFLILSSYLHLSFYIPQQNASPSPSGLLPALHTKPVRLHTRGQVISTLFFRNPNPNLPIPIFTYFITAFIYTLKSQGDKIQPFLILLSVLKHSLSHSFNLTQSRVLTYILLILFRHLPPKSYILSIYHSVFLINVSYEFSKSLNSTYIHCFCSRAFSTICFKVKI